MPFYLMQHFIKYDFINITFDELSFCYVTLS
jgi:hypothetical protein